MPTQKQFKFTTSYSQGKPDVTVKTSCMRSQTCIQMYVYICETF